MLDLSNPENCKALASRIKEDIDTYCKESMFEGHRNHLGASLMGDVCNRRLYYIFRWVKEEKHSGRIQRLFDAGKRAEPRFIKYLQGIGFEVWETDIITGKQFRISAHNGHYGGSLDGICKPPARYELDSDLVFLNEFKTNNTGSGYTCINGLHLSKAKPKHWAQICQYGYKYQIKYGLYLIENKNDSDITIKIVELDWQYGQILENKAGDIINAKLPPARIAENSSYHECKYCTFLNICHNGEAVEKNCRSCKLASPVENGEWFCDRYKQIIPKDFIAKGCDGHTSVNE